MEYQQYRSLTWCVAQSFMFVYSLYLLVPAKIQRLERNDPRHIKHRMIALFIITFVCGLVTWLAFTRESDFNMLLYGGLSLSGTFLPVLSYVILFLGPLSQMCLLPLSCEPNLCFDWWIDLRNLCIAPITEELVFRSFMAATVLPYFSKQFIVNVLPLFFGVAHVHHAIMRVRRRESNLRDAVSTALFQSLYTTLFGALMMETLLTTNNSLAIILIHSWCNLMGFPPILAIFDGDYELSRRIAVLFFYFLGIYLFFYFDKLIPLFYI